MFKALFIPILICSFSLALSACTASTISTEPSDLGTPISITEIKTLIDQPGPIEFSKHLAAKWSVNLSGLLNLDHPLAIEAGLQDKAEAIELYVYSIKHPTRGSYLIDSGISERFSSPADNPDISFLVKSVMNTDELKVIKSTHTLLEEIPGGIAGVFLTHIHMDHIMGMSDLPENTPVYSGPGESRLNKAEHMFTQGSTDRLLSNVSTLREWQFKDYNLVDIFGDKTVFAIHVPGHSPGSTAYLIRSTKGPQLLIGDATHTRWGWEHSVEPGTFSHDKKQSAASLQGLVKLSQQFPSILVHPGHQSL